MYAGIFGCVYVYVYVYRSVGVCVHTCEHTYVYGIGQETALTGVTQGSGRRLLREHESVVGRVKTCFLMGNAQQKSRNR